MRHNWIAFPLITMIVGLGAIWCAFLYQPYRVCGEFLCTDQFIASSDPRVEFASGGDENYFDLDKPVFGLEMTALTLSTVLGVVAAFCITCGVTASIFTYPAAMAGITVLGSLTTQGMLAAFMWLIADAVIVPVFVAGLVAAILHLSELRQR